MRSDEVAFKRATGVSLVGFALHTLLTLALLLYGIFAHDPSGVTAFTAAVLGLPIWLAMALLFHQHRLERIEAAEAEAFATSSAAQASVFDESSDDLRTAARRLSWMHRLLMPGFSLLVGGLYVAGGLWRFTIASADLEPDGFIPATDYSGWAVAIGLAIGVIGFVFARFVAGMAKQEVWANLRAGSGAIVGLSLIGLAMAVAHGAEFVGVHQPLRYLQTVIAVFMILLGAEIVLNFILNIYRPRRAGEIPRPAFDSRFLSFVAAPDRIATSISDAINYQFGSDVASTWFYRLLSRTLPRLVFLALIMFWGLTAFRVVDPSHKALVLRFGSLTGEVGSGLVIKAPWPISTVESFPAEHVNELWAGTPQAHDHGPILWTTKHTDGDERFLLVQPTPGVLDTRGAGDLSLMACEVPVYYVVEDLEKFTNVASDWIDPDDPDAMRKDVLKAVATSEVMRYLSTLNVEQLMGENRDAINAEIFRRVNDRFNDPDGLDAGVRILFAGLTSAHPPRDEDVALSFEKVVTADIRKAKDIEQAKSKAVVALAEVAGSVDKAEEIVRELRAREALTDPDEITAADHRIESLLDDAGGEAAVVLLKARADRWKSVMEYRADAEQQSSRIAAYKAAPSVYLARMYLDALRESVAGARLYITTSDDPDVQYDLTEIQANIDVFGIQKATKE
ncbi:MAG: hypothetical protein H6813_01155 [Phycisphaeraceae bacterium]|nr:hypothetical protein [Phycisphaeraceae bacterium]MCB9847306.1 hypothetical protein [Phycisphaeraceae bacterium]